MCAPAMSVDAWFAQRPEAYRRIYDAVIAHLETMGDVHVDAVDVGILIKRSRTFAELRPMRGRLALSVLLSRVVEHPRVTRTTRTSGSRAAHRIDLRDAADVDATVRAWLTESYHSSPV
jgi:hypothetical protein